MVFVSKYAKLFVILLFTSTGVHGRCKPNDIPVNTQRSWIMGRDTGWYSTSRWSRAPRSRLYRSCDASYEVIPT